MLYPVHAHINCSYTCEGTFFRNVFPWNVFDPSDHVLYYVKKTSDSTGMLLTNHGTETLRFFQILWTFLALNIFGSD